MYRVTILETAKLQLVKLAKSEPIAAKKVATLIDELRENPRTGTGHPEQLKNFENETWSRRITKKHRLVYQIMEAEVLVNVVSAFGHYNDK